MNAKAINQRYDNIKWVIVALLLIGGVIANFYFAKQFLSSRLIAWLVLLIVAALIALQTVKGARIWQLIKDARVEMRKVIWPTRQETIQTTAIVVVMVVIMALVLWGVDAILMWAVKFLAGQGG